MLKKLRLFPLARGRFPQVPQVPGPNVLLKRHARPHAWRPDAVVYKTWDLNRKNGVSPTGIFQMPYIIYELGVSWILFLYSWCLLLKSPFCSKKNPMFLGSITRCLGILSSVCWLNHVKSLCLLDSSPCLLDKSRCFFVCFFSLPLESPPGWWVHPILWMDKILHQCETIGKYETLQMMGIIWHSHGMSTIKQLVLVISSTDMGGFHIIFQLVMGVRQELDGYGWFSGKIPI